MAILKRIIKNIFHYLGIGNVYFKLRWFLKHGLKYFPIACYWNIDGWLSEGEAMALYDIALGLPEHEPVVVEIGSWLGKSSVILAKGMRKKSNSTLYCIDPFDATGDILSRSDYNQRVKKVRGTLKETFTSNVTKSGVYRYIKILEGKSYDFVEQWNKEIDFLFIDGDHSYEATLRDFLSWNKFIKTGGYIAFHDASISEEKMEIYHGGPYRVVKENILDSTEWTEKKFFNSLFVARKIQI